MLTGSSRYFNSLETQRTDVDQYRDSSLGVLVKGRTSKTLGAEDRGLCCATGAFGGAC